MYRLYFLDLQEVKRDNRRFSTLGRLDLNFVCSLILNQGKCSSLPLILRVARRMFVKIDGMDETIIGV